MSKMLSPMELYHAARETCVRLYVMNGGDKRDQWKIQPFPGTAAINCQRDPYDVGAPARWTLCMPAFPLDVRLPRWQCDLIGAYTVHELCHALWTDWEVVRQTHAEGLRSLCNALEDNRIEAKACRGDMALVHEARRLLEALNAHIAKRAMTTPGFKLDDPRQFSFVLGLVIFAEKLGYVSALPADWRKAVRPEWLPLFKLALDRFDALASTLDVLKLARDLKALAASLPKPKTPKLPKRPDQGGEVTAGGEGGETLPPMPMPEREITEPEPEPNDDDVSLEDLTGRGEDEPPVAPSLDDDDDAGKLPDAQEPGKPVAPAPGLEDDQAGNSEPSDGEPSPGESGEPGGRGGATSEDDDQPEPEPEPVEDLTDATQTYEEAHLNDIAQQVARDAGKSMTDVRVEAHHASTILNVPLPRNSGVRQGGDPKRASASIESPAKLRRHLTIAVKSPERVGVERRQVSGRLDMRNLVGLASGAQNVFRRRTEEEGREAAVCISMDVSGSMGGSRIAAAKAMALHMGDALKAAGVKFEVNAWDDLCMITPKPFAKGWSDDTRRAVAGLKVMSGTGMLPAMKASAERLLKVANVTRRILLVLTDGQDSYAQEANAALCAFYAARGVEIIGIGLQTNSVAAPFKGKATVVWNTSDLSTAGLGALVKLLDAGAPRLA